MKKWIGFAAVLPLLFNASCGSKDGSARKSQDLEAQLNPTEQDAESSIVCQSWCRVPAAGQSQLNEGEIHRFQFTRQPGTYHTHLSRTLVLPAGGARATAQIYPEFKQTFFWVLKSSNESWYAAQLELQPLDQTTQEWKEFSERAALSSTKTTAEHQLHVSLPKSSMLTQTPRETLTLYPCSSLDQDVAEAKPNHKEEAPSPQLDDPFSLKSKRVESKSN